MKKSWKAQIWIILLALIVLTGCLEPPEYSSVPKIALESLLYRQVFNPVIEDNEDKLVFTISVQDGDGDIGLVPDGTGELAEFFYIAYYDSSRVVLVDSTFNNVRAAYVNENPVGVFKRDSIQSLLRQEGLDLIGAPSQTGDSLFFQFQKTVQVERIKADYYLVTRDNPDANPPYYLVVDTKVQAAIYSTEPRPDYNCVDYQYDEVDDAYYYVKRNEKSANLIIKYFKKQQGVYVETSLASQNPKNDCPQLAEQNTIPIFDSERFGKAWIGNITYTEKSRGLNIFLSQDTLKIELYIYDRALNKSNTVEFSDFVLSDIVEQ